MNKKVNLKTKAFEYIYYIKEEKKRFLIFIIYCVFFNKVNKRKTNRYISKVDKEIAMLKPYLFKQESSEPNE